MASINAHALLGRGINARAEQAAQPHLDLLEAEAELAAAIEKHGRLWTTYSAPLFRGAFLLAVDCDVRRGLVLVHLVVTDAAGDIESSRDTVRLTGIEAVEAARARVAALQPDQEGHVWASDIFAAVRGDA